MRYFIILSFLIFSCTSDQIKESNIDLKAQDILSQMTLDESRADGSDKFDSYCEGTN